MVLIFGLIVAIGRMSIDCSGNCLSLLSYFINSIETVEKNECSNLVFMRNCKQVSVLTD